MNKAIKEHTGTGHFDTQIEHVHEKDAFATTIDR